MTYKERQMLLESHVFLKEKKDRKIKGQNLSGGNKQCTYIPKEGASSTSVSKESIILTSISNSKENRDMVVIDLLNAFIQTRIKDKKYMEIINLREVLVDILCKISPK